MATIAITGSAGGIGRATTERLESDGHRVIGIDVRDADVTADLSTEGGRRAMVREVDERCDGVLDGLVVGAGIQGKDDGAATVSINYFGAVATLTGLRPLLERGTQPSVVAISSNSVTTQPSYPIEVAEWCLADDEERARLAAGTDGIGAYPASKLALAVWVRRHAPGKDWAGAGIRLNAIAPGFIDTPLTEGLWEMVSSIGDIYPMPQGRPGEATEVAGLLAYLLSPEAAFFCGAFLVMDGGTEAALRPESWPRPLALD
ncbi:SDR family oxidoreductase [Aquihabitans sp. G128]|uniref:SDR family oxidoreductase n=1 Tax=Aquihabitans sp. G128 TaxID=2849779 RepID=UPI001C239A77|nr:SDR family oxidoreductase [Aquihabitans sp. G128]QXC59582.1 SDR family oxidoreductase [Aquihabitans sp. G128]